MQTWWLRFSVDGKWTEETVRAGGIDSAKKLIQAHYSGSKIYFSQWKRID